MFLWKQKFEETEGHLETHFVTPFFRIKSIVSSQAPKVVGTHRVTWCAHRFARRISWDYNASLTTNKMLGTVTVSFQLPNWNLEMSVHGIFKKIIAMKRIALQMPSYFKNIAHSNLKFERSPFCQLADHFRFECHRCPLPGERSHGKGRCPSRGPGVQLWEVAQCRL